MPIATGFPSILAAEGSVLNLPGARVTQGRRCFALLTAAQRKSRKAKRPNEKWERENLLWIAIPDDRPDLKEAVYHHHLGVDQEFKATYREEFPLPILESFELIQPSL